MKSGRHAIGALAGFAVAAAAAPLAHAQNQTAPPPSPAPTPAPAPAPAPAPSRSPSVFTLPGVVPERFSLGGQTPTPTPAPAPASTPSAAPAQSPATSAAAPRSPAPAVRRQPAPGTTPAARAPEAAATLAPQPATPSPVATPLAQPAATPAPAAASTGGAPWLWGLLGAGVTALLGLGGWLVLRRRGASDEEEEEAAPEPIVAPPAPEPVAAPLAPPPGLTPPRPPVADPFEIALNPLRVEIGERDVMLELELLVGNLQPTAAESIRVALALMSAHPQQDAVIAGFHGAPQGDPAGPPFDLPAGGGGRMPVRLTLPREHIHVVDLGGRPIVVPMVLVDLRWRSGLSIRRFGMDFMVGTAGQGGKLGPLWLDRAQLRAPLAATRYVAKAAVAA